MTNAILRGKPDAGNPHVRFDEGEVASYPPTVGRPEGVATRGAKPRRGSLLYSWHVMVLTLFPAFVAGAGVFGEAVRVPDVSDGAMSLAKEGNVLYCGADDALHVLDVSDALHPRLIRKITGFGFLRQLAVEKGWVAVASRSGGAWLVDARDPAKAHVVSHFETVEQATGIDLAGDLMFVGQRGNGVEFVDISDRSRPEHIRMVKTPESQTVVYENGYVYSGDWHAGATTIIDACDPVTARVVASTALQGLADGLDLDGRYLYAATGHHRLRGPHKDARHPENIGCGHGLEIWDRSDVLHPKFVSRVGFPRYWDIHNDLWTVRASCGWAFCADTYNGLFAVDARNPAQAKEVDRFCVKDPRNPQAPSCCISSVAIGDGAVYATAFGQGLWTLPCAVAKSRDRVRGSLPANSAWRADYPTVSDHFEAWLPPRRGQVHSVAAHGDVYFVGCSYAGCFIVDENLKTVGTVPCAYARDVVVRDGRLYVAQGDDGLGIYSLENPRAPREVARLRNFVPGVTRCEWVYVPTARWAICGDRRRQKWHFMDLKALPAAKCSFTVHNLNWFRPMADELLGGKWLGYAHTHSFVKWFDLSGDVPVMTDTANKAETGPLGRRTNFLRAKAGCNVFHDKLLISNDGGFVLLDPAQDRNADGSPWPVVKYANRPEVRVVGLPTWDGGDRVLLTCLNEMILSLVDFADPARPQLLWQEKTVGYPENAIFHRGRFLVPCGYQGLLRQRR